MTMITLFHIRQEASPNGHAQEGLVVMPYFAQHAERVTYARFVLSLVLLAIGLGVGIGAGLTICHSVVPPSPPICKALRA